MITNEKYWNFIYDQVETYKAVHLLIKQALLESGIQTEYVRPDEETAGKYAASNNCVRTFYKHDLQDNKKKIVGSCQRRRGKNLLVQGSIHITKKIDRFEFCNNLSAAFRSTLKVNTNSGQLNPQEIDYVSLEEEITRL